MPITRNVPAADTGESDIHHLPRIRYVRGGLMKLISIERNGIKVSLNPANGQICSLIRRDKSPKTDVETMWSRGAPDGIRPGKAGYRD